MSSDKRTVHVLCWSGSPETAERQVQLHYPACTISFLNQREFREQTSRRQLKILRGLRGQALVFFFSSPRDIRMPQVLAWSGLAHRCGETILATATGVWDRYRRIDWPKMFPKALLSAFRDVLVLCYVWVRLRVLPRKLVPVAENSDAPLDLAYIYPFPLDETDVGGAMTHVRGFLGGLASIGGTCQIYAGRLLQSDQFSVRVVPSKTQLSLFPEAFTLGFNLAFARRVRPQLKKCRPRALYQRHRRFAIAGALLSRRLGIPLILEFNGSEVWTARFWDPTRFHSWLALCEEFSLACASMIIVVSDVLRDELVSRGIPPARILVNPNGVDTDRFRPDCGGKQVRAQLGITNGDLVVGFVGTFSYWHGVDVLRTAILKVLDSVEQDSVLRRLKFLLIGQGPLFPDLKKAVLDHPRAEATVIFSGALAHDLVPSYLDATDIVLSPHVPMPDGRPFFGSPTKLFEYMAISKAIVASRLDQLAVVLDDQKTALLVAPGDPDELVAAIRALAADPRLRMRLGENAREVAISKHTWARNARQVLERLRAVPPCDGAGTEAEFSRISVAGQRI